MRLIGAKMGFGRGSLYFLSGFSMLLSPGRVCELVRALMLKRDCGVPVSRTAAAVFVERFYDALANASAIAAALVFADVPKAVLVTPLAVATALVILVLNGRLRTRLLERTARLRWARRLVPDPEELRCTVKILLGSSGRATLRHPWWHSRWSPFTRWPRSWA